ncbi:hypothetical protein BpHYR1_002572 [Brachionus plicatilis]|uniref:Uncharacterized protein n=1 Tax=Brachionus plicatilis TaxID=10195 RepID=A0A3M7RGN4_BRAPC|nr:hypothetical protein BpHYR1_002572 [Brachionus plicatilis]
MVSIEEAFLIYFNTDFFKDLLNMCYKYYCINSFKSFINLIIVLELFLRTILGICSILLKHILMFADRFCIYAANF